MILNKTSFLICECRYKILFVIAFCFAKMQLFLFLNFQDIFF